jgi:hypothetical protein
MAERAERRSVRVFLRLSPDVNERLRAAIRYQGDLSEYITDALVSVDLRTVALQVQKVSRDDPSLTAANGALRAASRDRRCSITALVNTAIKLWLEKRV